MVNEVGLVLLRGLFGPLVALLYMAAGLSVGIGGGLVLGRLGVERWVEPWVLEVCAGGGAISRDLRVMPSRPIARVTQGVNQPIRA